MIYSEMILSTLSHMCDITYLKVTAVLTVIALCASVGGHGAVTSVVLPLLDTNTHVGTGVLLTGGARTCGSPAIPTTTPRQKQRHTHTQRSGCNTKITGV